MNNSTFSIPGIHAASVCQNGSVTRTAVRSERKVRARQNYSGSMLNRAGSYIMVAVLFAVSLGLGQNGIAQTTTTISTSQTFTVPAGVSSMQVYVYGAGGGSGGAIGNSADQAGGGGGGGACAVKTFTVNANEIYTITIGAGGTAGANTGTAGGLGGTTTINGPGGVMTANGGTGGGGAAAAGAAGTAGAGATTGSGFTTLYNGGNGTVGYRSAASETGGAGGGGAGSAGAGGNGSGSLSGTTGGAGGTGTPTNVAPYKGGAGATGVNTTGSLIGVAGNAPGGGAAGAATFTAARAGAAGGAGQVVLIYTVPMSYTSSTTTQLNNGSAFALPSTNNQIIQVQVVTSGTASPFNMTSMLFSTAGSTNPATDIANAKVYYTGTSSTFATTTQFGTTFTGPNGVFTVNGNQALSPGTNYFWLTYDITSSANIGDLIDACCNSIVMNGAGGTQTPTVTCPAGSASVNYCTPSFPSYDGTDYIANVTLNTLNNTSTGTAIPCYTNYCPGSGSTTTTLRATNTYTISIKAGTDANQHFGAFIDFNKNGLFTDAGEKIFGDVIIAANGTATASFTVPANAMLGVTRLRVVDQYNAVANPCPTTSFGEAEDYCITIAAALPVISSTSPTSSCEGQSITITGTNFTNPITSVTFGGVAAATFAYVNATTITATVPAGAASGAIEVTQASGTGTSTILFGVYSIPAPIASNNGPICVSNPATLIASGMAPGGTVAAFTGTTGTSASNTSVANNFTMDFWVKPTGTITINPQATTGTTGLTGQRYAVMPPQSGANGGAGVSVGTNGISVYEHGNGYLTPLLSYTYPASVNSFIHVAVVYSARRPSLYINGTKVATGLASTFGTSSYPGIGSDGATGANYGPFTGSLDNYRIWNGSLTQGEILSVMFNQNGTTSKTKLAQYTFNGNTVTDAVGANPNWNTPASFTAPNYFTYTWTGTSAPAASTAESQTTTAGLTANENYTVIASINGSCPGAESAVTTVIVNQPSADPTSATASETTICNGDATTLTLNGGGGGTGEVIRWYSASCGGTPEGTGNNLSVSPTTTTTYFGRYENGAPCNYNSLCASVTVTVNPNYTITASAGANGSVSPNGVTTLSCFGTGSQSYTITAAACYSIADVLVDGSSVGAVGTYTFTNVTANHTISATFVINTYTITVTAGANGSITPATGSVNCGDNATYTITPDACYSIADVVVDGVSQGAVGTYTFTNVTTNHTISATFTLNGPYTITVTAGANGSITPGTGSVNCGGNATYTITADACYSIADVVVDGVSQGAVGTYTFTNVTTNHTISATFTVNGPYTITVTSGANGSITPGTGSVNCGDNATYTITSDACYSIADVIVDGVSQGAVGTYTFTNVTANHTISATFVLSTYTITATAGANGSITPATGSVNCGDNATYTITADACYAIADVVVDGVSQGAVGTYTFTNVTANHTISATFVLSTYTITVTAGANGSITPATGSVNCGDNATYTITPEACYHILDVLVDGVSVGAVGTYTFTNVIASHTISATFTVNITLPTPVVSGVVNVCPYVGTGTQLVYNTSVPGAVSYTWVIPANVTIISGQGTGTLTITIQNGFASNLIKKIKVTASSDCGSSPQATFVLVLQAPNTPSSIVASSNNICAVVGTAGTISYTIPSVVAATSYTWVAQAGTTINHPNGAGINDTTVTVSFANSFATSAITVQSNNSCGSSSNVRSLTITRANPATPGLISGSTNACPYMAPGGSTASYSIVPVANATSYNWTVPSGAIGLTGQGSTSISFKYPSGFTGGTISVTATNGCGTSQSPRTLSINKLNASTPGVIDVVQLTTCPARQYSYTIAAMPANTISLVWSVPPGATILSGQGTVSITVAYPSTAVVGNVTVQSINNCSSSSVRSTSVKLSVCSTGRSTFAKAGSEVTPANGLQVTVYPNPTVNDFKLQVVTAGKQTISVRILDAQGRCFKVFEVMPYQTINVGAELKAGTYMMEVRQGNEVKVTKLLKF